jgi:acetoacetate decarboxylase
MPDHGLLTEDRLPHAAPTIAPLYPAPPWPLPGARVLKVIFETDKEPVLNWLPPKLTRSAPPYATVIVEHFPKTPVGPFTLASQYIGCRAGFFIRAFALQAIVDNPLALTALREVWGIPAVLGEVQLRARKGDARATVSRDGAVLAELSVAETQSMAPEVARFDPVLSLRMTPSVQEGKPPAVEMVQIDPDYHIKEVHRGRGEVRYGATNGTGASWGVLPVRNIVSAVYCLVDTELPLARFVIPY